MKLKKKTFTKKDGTTGYSYDVKKINEFGEGLQVKEVFSMRCDFAPEYKTIKYKKDGQDKTFEVINVLGKPMPETLQILKDYEAHETYNNAYFVFPERLGRLFINVGKDDVVSVWLDAVEVEKNGKKERRTQWNGKVTSAKQQQERKVTNENTVAVSSMKVTGLKPAVAPQEREAHIPAELQQEWLPEIKNMKQDFLREFTSPTILEGTEKPQKFFDWLMQPEECGTDYFFDMYETTEDKKGTERSMYACFWGLLDAMK